jgi:hypothetical protein
MSEGKAPLWPSESQSQFKNRKNQSTSIVEQNEQDSNTPSQKVKFPSNLSDYHLKKRKNQTTRIEEAIDIPIEQDKKIKKKKNNVNKRGSVNSDEKSSPTPNSQGAPNKTISIIKRPILHVMERNYSFFRKPKSPFHFLCQGNFLNLCFKFLKKIQP